MPTKKPYPKSKSADILTPEEKAAMKDLAKERKAAARGAAPDGETDLLAKIAEMAEPDRSLAAKLHTLIKSVAPSLAPKTWYGMPAWAKDDKVLCFFQSASKFKTRYATLGFSDKATLDAGNMWPTAFALKALTPTEESAITQLLQKAIS